MGAHRIYLSPSNQKENNGVSGYNERIGMHLLADSVAKYLKAQNGQFEVFISNPDFSLEQVVDDSNNLAVEIHVCLHSDATGTSDPGGGTTAFAYGETGEGKRLADLLYKYVAPISPMGDHGVTARPGLYELRKTKAPSALIENFFHTNATEVADFNANIDKYAQAISKAICEYFGVQFILPQVKAPAITSNAPDYKKEGEQWLYDHGYIKDRHDPLEKLDVGTFGKILQHFCEKNKIGE